VKGGKKKVQKKEMSDNCFSISLKKIFLSRKKNPLKVKNENQNKSFIFYVDPSESILKLECLSFLSPPSVNQII
jgi:hypothetical protein